MTNNIVVFKDSKQTTERKAQIETAEALINEFMRTRTPALMENIKGLIEAAVAQAALDVLKKLEKK
jgi:hypothetical protein